MVSACSTAPVASEPQMCTLPFNAEWSNPEDRPPGVLPKDDERICMRHLDLLNLQIMLQKQGCWHE